MAKNKAQLLFARLIELPKRFVDFDKNLKVIFNGDENDYSERVEALIPNSITAKQCAKLFRQFLTGKGFGDKINKSTVNTKKNIKFLKFFNQFNVQYAKHAGTPVHVQYKASGEKDRFEVLPFVKVRKGKKDDNQFNGKFAIAKGIDFQGCKKNEITWAYAFNPDPEIVKKQIEDSGGIAKYPGQIFYFNPSDLDYPLAHIHPVMNDTDSEMRTSVFKNKSLRKGFFGKNILITPPRVNPDLKMQNKSNLSKEQLLDLRHQESLADETGEALKGFVGVENHEGFMLMEMEFNGDNIDKIIKHIEIPTNIDDKIFKHTEDSVSNNIRKAYNNVPRVLVDSSADGKMFSESGKLMIEAKLFYVDQTEEDRMLIFEAMEELFSGFKGIDLDIKQYVPIISREAQIVEPVNKKNKNKR